MALDEQALRKPGWREGDAEWVVLGDGNRWALRKPKLCRELEPGDAGGFAFGAWRRTLGGDFDAALDRVVEEERGGGVRYESVVGLALSLLAPQYELAPADVRALFPLIIDDPDNEAMWQAVADVALGNAPKPGAATSE